MRPHGFYRLCDAACHLDVVVLNHDHVIQPHPVVRSPAVFHCHLVQHPHARCGFPRIQKLRVRPCQFSHIPCRLRCDARHALQDVQRQPFAQQQATVTCLNAQNHVPPFHPVAVLHLRVPHDVFLKTFIHPPGNLQSGNHPVCFHFHLCHGARMGGDNRLRRHVSRSDIFFNGKVNQPVNQILVFHLFLYC